MINSIQHFCSEGVKNLEKVMMDYSADITKISEMVQGVTKGVTELGQPLLPRNGKAMMNCSVNGKS